MKRSAFYQTSSSSFFCNYEQACSFPDGIFRYDGSLSCSRDSVQNLNERKIKSGALRRDAAVLSTKQGNSSCGAASISSVRKCFSEIEMAKEQLMLKHANQNYESRLQYLLSFCFSLLFS